MKLKQLHQVFNQLICESHTCSCTDRRSRSALGLHGGAVEHLELWGLNKYILMHGGSQHCFLTFTLTVNPEPSCSETLLFFLEKDKVPLNYWSRTMKWLESAFKFCRQILTPPKKTHIRIKHMHTPTNLKSLPYMHTRLETRGDSTKSAENTHLHVPRGAAMLLFVSHRSSFGDLNKSI